MIEELQEELIRDLWENEEHLMTVQELINYARQGYIVKHLTMPPEELIEQYMKVFGELPPGYKEEGAI